MLPFTNMSGDPEQEYFSDGITEDIITELSRFRSLFVIARNSSFTFKGKAVKVTGGCEGLGVAYVVEGSVRKVGNRIRITAQLIEAAGGRHVWAERYDRPAEDIFAIQDEVVRTVVATLAGRLEAKRAEGLRRRPTTSLSAYECVLRGNALPVGDPAPEAVAHQLFEQAIALDPDYARAYAQLAISHAKRWEDNMGGSSRDLIRAFELATRAVILDAQESECHTALGYVHLLRRQYDEAEFHVRKALALNPNRPNALATLGVVLARSGQPDTAVELITDAMRTRSPSSYLVLDGAGSRTFRGTAIRRGSRCNQASSGHILLLGCLSCRKLRATGRRGSYAWRGGGDHTVAARLLSGSFHARNPTSGPLIKNASPAACARQGCRNRSNEPQLPALSRSQLLALSGVPVP